MVNNRAEIYFFNGYCINIVQTIFFSLGAEFVYYWRDGSCWMLFGPSKGKGEEGWGGGGRAKKRSTCGIDWHLRVLLD